MQKKTMLSICQITEWSWSEINCQFPKKNIERRSESLENYCSRILRNCKPGFLETKHNERRADSRILHSTVIKTKSNTIVEITPRKKTCQTLPLCKLIDLSYHCSIAKEQVDLTIITRLFNLMNVLFRCFMIPKTVFSPILTPANASVLYTNGKVKN